MSPWRPVSWPRPGKPSLHPGCCTTLEHLLGRSAVLFPANAPHPAPGGRGPGRQGSREPVDAPLSDVTQGVPVCTDEQGLRSWEVSSAGCKVKCSLVHRPWGAGAVRSPVPAPQTGLVSLLKLARSSPVDIVHLCSALPLGPHSTPGQLSNLEVELHLSVNDEAGEVVVMRRRAGGSTSWDSYCSHM